MNYIIISFHLLIFLIFIAWQEKRYHNIYKILSYIFPKEKARRIILDNCINLIKVLLRKGPKIFWFEFLNLRNLYLKNKKSFKLKEWKNEKLVFPYFENPEVSIMILCFNNSRYTFNCLKSLLKNTKYVSYEIIVIDNASTDNTQRMLRNIRNIKVIRNPKNYGFGKAYNKNIKFAKGKYLFFLNNDVMVTKNWLPPLLKTIKKENVGATSGKLIFPNWTIQDAGGVVVKGGPFQSYGRDDCPEKPEYNFVREVDYCSGAALLVRKDLFLKVKGFDKRFEPFYSEDVDLCFSLRKLGYKVIYQPLAEFIHYESVSALKLLGNHQKRDEIIENHRQRFLKKWNKTLEREKYRIKEEFSYLDRFEKTYLLRDRRNGKKILIAFSGIIKKDMLEFLKKLSQNNQITLICKPLQYLKTLQQYGIEVLYEPFIKDYLNLKGKYFEIVALNYKEKDIINYCKRAKYIFFKDLKDLNINLA